MQLLIRNLTGYLQTAANVAKTAMGRGSADRDVVRDTPLGAQGFTEVERLLLQVPVITALDQMHLGAYEIDRQPLLANANIRTTLSG